MSIYKSYKHGGKIKQLVNINGFRRTFNSLRKNLGKVIRIKHNRIQLLVKNKRWVYET